MTLPARGEGAEEMALSSPAQRRKPSISIRARFSEMRASRMLS